MAAGLASLASRLEHDVCGIVVRLEEELLGVVHEARYPVFPGGVALGEVEHESRAVQVHGVVVGPLCLSKSELDRTHFVHPSLTLSIVFSAQFSLSPAPSYTSNLSVTSPTFFDQS